MRFRMRRLSPRTGSVEIRRFYLSAGRWGSWLLSVGGGMLLYVPNTAFMTGVQVADAASALALKSAQSVEGQIAQVSRASQCA
jgi:hypothetical protein